MNDLVFDETQSQAPRAIATAPPEPLNPLMLLQQAVANGMDAGQLKTLVDLQEQYRAARARESFSAAMNAVQIEMPCVVRDATNSKTNTGYIRLETLTHRAKPIYTAHGFSLSFSETESKRESWHRVTCTVRHIDGHTEQHWIELPTDGIGPQGKPIGGMNAVQGAVSTGTYGQRVLTCRVFNITIADSDLDGEAPNPPANPAAPKAEPRGKRTPAPEVAQEVSKSQCAYALGHWRNSHPSTDQDVAAWNEKFHGWVRFTSKREFEPKSSANWTWADYKKVCAALNINPEDAQ